MGTLSFQLPAALTPELRRCLDRAAVTDATDLTPVHTRREVRGDRLILSKDTAESACVAVPWPVTDCGCPVVRTGTLRERTDPYNLPVELARGKLYQLRNQLAQCEQAGMAVDADVRTSLAGITRGFGRVVVDPTAPDLPDVIDGVLAGAHDLGDRLTRAYADHRLSTRVAADGPIPSHLSVRLADRPADADAAAVTDTFTAVRLCPDWRRIEAVEADYEWAEFDDLVAWAVATRLPVSVGPLIDLGRGLPEWLDPWVGDLPSLAAFMCDFAETCVRRYLPVVQTWEVFRGFNHADRLGLGEDDRLRLAARLLESCRDTAPDAEWVVTMTQPFGDYLTSDDLTYSPYVFADTLLRAGYRLSAVNLDLAPGPRADAGLPRDPLEIARILEHFGSLGIPLETTFGPPGGRGRGERESGCDDVAARWTGTSVALSVASSHVRTVHWNVTEVASPPGPDAATPLLDSLRAAPAHPTLAELRPYLA